MAPSESSPLLPAKAPPKKTSRRWSKTVIYRVYFTAFIVAVSFGVTQVPLVYIFGVMTCEEYYRHHQLPPMNTPAYDSRCEIRSIEASTARAVALLGSGTTLFGVANLFVTGWTIKVWGIKRALLITIFWPAIRLAVQNVGVMTGAGKGIIIIQLSQITTVFGGPAGYILELNSFATEVVLPVERTATIGRLTCCAMFGGAFGFLAGGMLMDWFGNLMPFRVTLFLFCISTAYGYVFLPYVPLSEEVAKKASRSLGSFFDPLKMFIPRRWVLLNGTVRREYGVLLLGAGAFLAVFATGYIPTMLQMYATDVLHFGAADNSELISLNFAIRATFLTFAFPAIIDKGRKWLMERNRKADEDAMAKDEDVQETTDDLPISPGRLVGTVLPAGESNVNEPNEPLRRISTSQSTRPEENESYAFDLFYTRWSLLLDGILTALASLTSNSWQMYLVAIVIPFAAGTGSAAKGTMLQMCTPEQKNDALSAISLLELVARLSTTSLFGLIFAAFASIGKPNLTFAVNGGVAVIGFLVLLFAKFPPNGACRYEDDDEEGSGTGG